MNSEEVVKKKEEETTPNKTAAVSFSLGDSSLALSSSITLSENSSPSSDSSTSTKSLGSSISTFFRECFFSISFSVILGLVPFLIIVSLLLLVPSTPLQLGVADAFSRVQRLLVTEAILNMRSRLELSFNRSTTAVNSYANATVRIENPYSDSFFNSHTSQQVERRKELFAGLGAERGMLVRPGAGIGHRFSGSRGANGLWGRMFVNNPRGEVVASYFCEKDKYTTFYDFPANVTRDGRKNCTITAYGGETLAAFTPSPAQRAGVIILSNLFQGSHDWDRSVRLQQLLRAKSSTGGPISLVSEWRSSLRVAPSFNTLMFNRVAMSFNATTQEPIALFSESHTLTLVSTLLRELLPHSHINNGSGVDHAAAFLIRNDLTVVGASHVEPPFTVINLTETGGRVWKGCIPGDAIATCFYNVSDFAPYRGAKLALDASREGSWSLIAHGIRKLEFHDGDDAEDVDNQRVGFHVRLRSDSPKFPLSLLVVMPRRFFLQDSIEVRQNAIAISIVLIVIGAALSYVVLWASLHSIKALSKKMQDPFNAKLRMKNEKIKKKEQRRAREKNKKKQGEQEGDGEEVKKEKTSVGDNDNNNDNNNNNEATSFLEDVLNWQPEEIRELEEEFATFRSVIDSIRGFMPKNSLALLSGGVLTAEDSFSFNNSFSDFSGSDLPKLVDHEEEESSGSFNNKNEEEKRENDNSPTISRSSDNNNNNGAVASQKSGNNHVSVVVCGGGEGENKSKLEEEKKKNKKKKNKRVSFQLEQVPSPSADGGGGGDGMTKKKEAVADKEDDFPMMLATTSSFRKQNSRAQYPHEQKPEGVIAPRVKSSAVVVAVHAPFFSMANTFWGGVVEETELWRPLFVEFSEMLIERIAEIGSSATLLEFHGDHFLFAIQTRSRIIKSKVAGRVVKSLMDFSDELSAKIESRAAELEVELAASPTSPATNYLTRKDVQQKEKEPEQQESKSSNGHIISLSIGVSFSSVALVRGGVLGSSSSTSSQISRPVTVVGAAVTEAVQIERTMRTLVSTDSTNLCRSTLWDPDTVAHVVHPNVQNLSFTCGCFENTSTLIFEEISSYPFSQLKRRAVEFAELGGTMDENEGEEEEERESESPQQNTFTVFSTKTFEVVVRVVEILVAVKRKQLPK